MNSFFCFVVYFFIPSFYAKEGSISGFDQIKDDIVIKIPRSQFVFSLPVDLFCITKIVKGRTMHFIVETSSNVFSMDDGKVLLIDRDHGMVIIFNKDVKIIYSSLKKIVVHEGECVRKGQIIGVANQGFFVQIRIDNVIVDFLNHNYFTPKEWSLLSKFLKN